LQPEIPLSELPQYVTERGNPGNEKGLLEARVELPVPFLRRGLHFVDTPGVGSAKHENTQTTYEFLPQADAVIFVTSVEAPLSEAEEVFLRDVRQYVRKLFIVVNKTDLLAVSEREEVLRYIQTGIERTLGASETRLYAVSARQALAAKLGGDEAERAESGLNKLEEDLAAFLAAERGQIFLVGVLDRVLRLAVDSSELETLCAAIEALRNQLIAGNLLVETSLAAELSVSSGDVGARQLAPVRSEETRSPDRLPLESSTCPICASLSRALLDFFVDLQYSIVISQSARQTLAEHRGLCCQHTWQLQATASPQGISEGYVPLMDSTLAVLRTIERLEAAAAVQQLALFLATPETCPACQLLRKLSNVIVPVLVNQLATTDGRQRYTRGRGLCLPHLRATLSVELPDETAAFLIKSQIRRLEEISEDMRSYTLKREALRRGLHNRDEENAWRRALVQLVGERTAFTPNEPRSSPDQVHSFDFTAG